MKKMNKKELETMKTDYVDFLDLYNIEPYPWYEHYYNIVRYKIEDFLYDCKMEYQVLTRGYSDRNVYNMYYDLAELNIKLLTQLRDTQNGHPSQLTEKSWKKALTKMIEAFETVVNDNPWNLPVTEQIKNTKKFKEGMALYTQHYRDLWD